jgi:putative transposase
VVMGLKRDFEELMKTDCSDVIAVIIDEITFGERANQIVVLTALGVSKFGVKKLLGIWSGGTENSGVCGALVDDPRSRGLRRPELTVLDGSKALRKAILESWEDALIGRCQEHKRRNLLGHVSKSQQGWVTREYNSIIYADSYEAGYERAVGFARELRRVNESAYRSFCEGLDKVLVPLLIEDRGLRRFFSTTNPLESVFSTIRLKTGRVKLWTNANSVMNWISSAYRLQRGNFRRIRGHKNIEELYKLSSRLVKAKKRLKHIDLEQDFVRRAA